MEINFTGKIIPSSTEGCCQSLPIRLIQLGIIQQSPSLANVELREDGSYELREDGNKELREQ